MMRTALKEWDEAHAKALGLGEEGLKGTFKRQVRAPKKSAVAWKGGLGSAGQTVQETIARVQGLGEEGLKGAFWWQAGQGLEVCSRLGPGGKQCLFKWQRH